MYIIFDIESHHIEKAAETTLTARKNGNNERLAVEEYCVNHDLFCMPDVFCLAIGLVEREKTKNYTKLTID